MNKQRIVGIIVTALVLLFVPVPAAAEEFSHAVQAFLQQRARMEKRDAGIVVGRVDIHGSRIVASGSMENGTGRRVDGDTLFQIGSITKTFTALLLQDMIERDAMRLDDPVAKYLPASVRMPTRNGKEITLRQLVTTERDTHGILP